MPILFWEKDESVAVVTMSNGENRHNPDFAKAFNDVLDEIRSDSTITAVVITSDSEKFWSLGIDVDWIGNRMNENATEDIKAFMYSMNKVFRNILLFPVPVIAALGGHAFGNGAILACACDFRFMKSDRGYFCLPEVDLGIPFLPSMIPILQKAILQYKLNELMLTGKRAGAAELEAHHVLVKAGTDARQMMADALSFAKSFAKNRGIFAEHKKRMYRHITDAMEKDDPYYIDSLFLFVAE